MLLYSEICKHAFTGIHVCVCVCVCTCVFWVQSNVQSNKSYICRLVSKQIHIQLLLLVDLMTMMLECSDLSAPQKAKGFVKKCINEVQPVKKNVVSYQESQKAHKWNQTTETLTELFTLPGN